MLESLYYLHDTGASPRIVVQQQQQQFHQPASNALAAPRVQVCWEGEGML